MAVSLQPKNKTILSKVYTIAHDSNPVIREPSIRKIRQKNISFLEYLASNSKTSAKGSKYTFDNISFCLLLKISKPENILNQGSKIYQLFFF